MMKRKLTLAVFLSLTCMPRMDMQDVPNNVCFDKVDKVRNIKHGQVIVDTTFISFKDLCLLGCVKQCLVRGKCQSFNYHFDKLTCDLNAINSSTINAVVSTDQGSAYSDIESWPGRVAGSCLSHACAGNTVCVDKRKGSPYCKVECPDPLTVRNGQILSEHTCHEVGCVIKYNCSVGYVQSGAAVCGRDGSWSAFGCVQGCGNPPLVKNAVLDASENNPTVGRALNYTCNKPLVGLGKVQCRADFTWSKMECIPIVRSCVELKACSSGYTDGEYWLVPKVFVNKPVKIYCYNMKLKPQEFITLPEENYVDYSATACESWSPGASSPSAFISKGCRSVRYEKVKISDVHKMKVYENGMKDCTFTNISRPCMAVQFGGAFDCHVLCGSSESSRFVIDTRNTGLMVDPNTKWFTTGKREKKYAEMECVTFSGNVIEGHCRERCAWCYPDRNTIKFVMDPDNLPDIVTATIPSCG